MKKRIAFILLFLSATHCFSQESGFGFYAGYSWGKYSPGLGNLESYMYLYDKEYGANFNYNDHLRGPAFGVRIIAGYWQTDIEWILRHSEDESTFIDPATNTEGKMGLRTRYNTLFWGNAFRYKNFAIGAGVDIGRFKLWSKVASLEEYDKTDYSRNTFFGSKVAISKLLDVTGGFIFYAEYMPNIYGIRLYYSIPMGNEEFADDANLSFYTFRPSNWGVSIFLNLSILK